MPIPDLFAADFRLATDQEVRSWSYGQIKKTRVSSSKSFDDHIGTLLDERIFGSSIDYRCACGQYDGKKFNGMICDRCGVKIATAESRRTRFGHIEFRSEPTGHPFDLNVDIKCYPVIPATFLESPSGIHLCELYENLLVAPENLGPLIEFLTPIAACTIEWQTQDADIFTRGLGLVRKVTT